MWRNRRSHLARFGCSVVVSVFLAAAICQGQSQPTAPVPNLSLSVNGKPIPQTIQGEALIFSAVLFHPKIFANNVTPLLINAQGGSWGNTVRIVVTDSTGAAAPWPIHFVSA